MKLEVHERLALLSLLPKQGDYAALKTIRRARETLDFTPEEMKAIDMKQEVIEGKPQIFWNDRRAADAIKDIPIDEYTTSLFRDALAKLNKEKKLTDQYMSVYEKLVVMYL